MLLLEQSVGTRGAGFLMKMVFGCAALGAIAAPGSCHAATGPDSTAAASTPEGVHAMFTTAALETGSEPALPVSLSVTNAARPASAGVADSLPDLPEAQSVGSPLPHYLYQFTVGSEVLPGPQTEEEGVQYLLRTSPNSGESDGVSQLESLPLITAARRLTGGRFNTTEASVDDFAICYRLSRAAGLQLIPGDPAPVKLPVTSMANNRGVTVGMVFRLPGRH